MNAPWVCAALVACSAVQVAAPLRIAGSVRDVQGHPLPGATITIVGGATRAVIVTDWAGEFHSAGLNPGPYSVTASLAGFRPRTEPVDLRGESRTSLGFTLTAAPLVTILWVVPLAPVADADVIAHIRIARTAPPGACGQIVTALHDVIVIESFKGTVDARAAMKQEGAGVCVDDGRRVQGYEPVYRVGDEYIVFLRNGPTAFGRVAGPSLTFAVVDGRVTTHGFAGLPQEVPVAVFRGALAKMMRL